MGEELLIRMGRISIERLKYFYTANYVLGKLPPGYFLGLDLGTRYFGAACSTPDLAESFPVRAKFSQPPLMQTRSRTSTTSSSGSSTSAAYRSASFTACPGPT